MTTTLDTSVRSRVTRWASVLTACRLHFIVSESEERSPLPAPRLRIRPQCRKRAISQALRSPPHQGQAEELGTRPHLTFPCQADQPPAAPPQREVPGLDSSVSSSQPSLKARRVKTPQTATPVPLDCAIFKDGCRTARQTTLDRYPPSFETSPSPVHPTWTTPCPAHGVHQP